MTKDQTGLTINRRFPAERSVLWDALTNPQTLSAWWWPERFQTRYNVDLAVGGNFHFTTADMPGMGVLELAGGYLQVEEPSRLEFTWRWTSDPGHESHVLLEFSDEGSDCALVVNHHGLKDAEDRDNHVQGWNDCLDRLEELLQPPSL